MPAEPCQIIGKSPAIVARAPAHALLDEPHLWPACRATAAASQGGDRSCGNEQFVLRMKEVAVLQNGEGGVEPSRTEQRPRSPSVDRQECRERGEEKAAHHASSCTKR